MAGGTRSQVGVVLGSSLPPARIPAMARRAEELGYGEVWLAEDYFFTGGISGATAALAATREIPVGLGIVSAMVRHPAVLAMELATMESMFPGRLLPGIGLGVPFWLDQMGIRPRSTLTALRECVTSTRRLLAGETLTDAGAVFAFDDVTLTHPPATELPLYMGVIGPKNLELSGEIADGTVVSVLAAPEYVRWTRERLAAGAAKAGRDPAQHRIACFVLFSVDSDGEKARESMRDATAFYLCAMGANALTDVHGSSDELRALIAQGGMQAVSAGMPSSWLDDLVVAGDPAECAAKIRAYLDAGADSVVLFPTPVEDADAIVERAAAEVLPLLG